MKIRIRGRKVAISDRLRAHVERKVGLALARFGDRVTVVSVSFSPDKVEETHLCRIDVRIRPPTFQVEDASSDLFAAADHAALRAARSLARHFEKEREPK